MKTIRLFLVVVVFAFNNIPVQALELAPTPSNEFMEAPPLIISGYQTGGSGTSLAAVEVYNDAKNLVDLTTCKLALATKDLKVREVAVISGFVGYLQPKQHAVFSKLSATTYQIADSGTSPIVSLEIKCTTKGKTYKPAAASIKDQSDLPMFRAYTSTGYSTAAQPFAATPSRSFYDDGLYEAPLTPQGLQVVEVYPYASSCAPNDSSVLCNDYVKLQNTSSAEIALDGLVLRTDYYGLSRSVSNTVALQGALKPGEFSLVSLLDGGAKLSLSNSGGYLWLEDVWGLVRYDDTMTKYEGAGSSEQGYAYARDNLGAWQWTTTPQPQGENKITLPVKVVAECPAGKFRNPETGRCRTIEEAVNSMSACDEGYERNPTTNRCRKILNASASTLTPCLEGQERNPATNRCRSIAKAVAELLPCDEGYERNPATNRCRKAQSSDVPQVAFPVQPMEKGVRDNTGWLAFAAVIAIVIGYGLWEWRHEIATLGRKSLGLLHRSK